MKRLLLLLCAAAALFPIAKSLADDKTPAQERVVLVGDSTMASGSGWGDAFGKLLAPRVEFRNQALKGRSSKSFRDEGAWQKVLNAKPTWVLIQFGHNDMPGKGPKLETDAQTTFRQNLARYIADARAIGAKPVIVTSLTRRNFNAEGKIVPEHLEPMTDSQGKATRDYLNDYVEAARAVAAEQKVPLLDLNARSIEQLNQLGPKAALAFDAKTKDPSKPDKTHLSPKGAEETAKLVADEIRKNAPELARLLKPAMSGAVDMPYQRMYGFACETKPVLIAERGLFYWFVADDLKSVYYEPCIGHFVIEPVKSSRSELIFKIEDSVGTPIDLRTGDVITKSDLIGKTFRAKLDADHIVGVSEIN